MAWPKGKPHAELRARWADPEFRERMSGLHRTARRRMGKRRYVEPLTDADVDAVAAIDSELEDLAR